MSDKCANPNYNIENGDFCFGGKPRGVAFCDTDLAVDITSLQTLSWWTSQVIASTNRVTAIVNSNFSETTPGEVQEHTPEFGFSVQTSKTSVMYMLKWQGNLCLRRAFDRFNGKSTYVMLITDKNGIIGVRNGATQLKFTKAMVSTYNEEIDNVDYNVLKLSFALDFETLKKQIQLQDDFIADEIPKVTGVYFEGNTALAATISVYAYDCQDTLLEGLDDTTYFTVYNDTDATSEAGTWAEVSGLYTFTYSVAVDVGDFITISYTGPGSGNSYIIAQEATQETTV
jgi:hypothetical protein